MLEALQQIVVNVGEAEDLQNALRTIVHGVREAMLVDQCSIYLVDPDDHADADQLVLTATDGLEADAVGRVRLAFNEGLVGLVASKRRTLSVTDAAQHPQYKHFPITGENRFHAFLGVPVVHYRKVVGVLVVQRERNVKFSVEDEAFLVTISAQLAGAVHGAAMGEHLRVARSGSAQAQLRGIAGAPGVAVGTPILPSPFADLDQVHDREHADAELEEQRYAQAVADVRTELLASGERFRDVLPDETRDLFDVYIQLASDETLTSKVVERIRAGQWAPAALRDTIAELSTLFDSIEDARLSARGEDVRAVGRRILLQLHPDARESSEYPDRCILVGNEVSLARIADVPTEKLAGIVCFEGSALSHTAVLARSLGIPAVMGIGQLPPDSFSSGLVVVDGYEGRIFANPLPIVLDEFHRLEQEEWDLALRLRAEAPLPALTPDGIELQIHANIALLTDIEPALRAGPAGVGLYRTEFPFMLRESFPGEEDQISTYTQVLENFAPRPVVMRTLDIGGDKPLPYFPLDDKNPSLGWRGVRVSLNHPEIFAIQIRAMLRANIGRNNLRIMLPMVSTLGEIEEALALIGQSCAELQEEGLAVAMPPVGAMIEVPALLYQMPLLANLVDFFSIGTNDLTQYLMAADRDNPKVADLYDQLQPAVLMAIRRAVDAARTAGKQITICGELASDPGGVVLLLGMGVDGLSVAPAALAKTKWVVRSFSQRAARDLLETALEQRDPEAVKSLLGNALEEAGVGGLVRAGK